MKHIKNAFQKKKETHSDSCLEIGVATFDFVLAHASGSGSESESGPSNYTCAAHSLLFTLVQ